MAVVLKEQLELRPSVALQKKVGLKSLEQVIRWGDRVNQELRRLRKLGDRKCWSARARRIRKKSRIATTAKSHTRRMKMRKSPGCHVQAEPMVPRWSRPDCRRLRGRGRPPIPAT